MSALTKYAASGAIALSPEAQAAAMEAAADAMRSGGGGGDAVEFVSFSGKSGDITYGRDRAPLDEDQIYLLDSQSFVVGWVCWANSSPISRHEWSIFEPSNAVRASDLEDHGPYRKSSDGWQSMSGFGFMSDGGETKFKFTTNSKSGKNAVSDLLEEVAARQRAGEPSYPLFRFTSERFLAQGEWNYKPAFLIDDWLTEDEAEAFAAGETEVEEVEEVEEVQPARTRRTARK